MAHEISSSDEELERVLQHTVGNASTPQERRGNGGQRPVRNHPMSPDVSPIRRVSAVFGAPSRSPPGVSRPLLRRNTGERAVVRFLERDLSRTRVPRGREFEEMRDNGLVRNFTFNRRLSVRQVQARLRELFSITEGSPVFHYLRSTVQGNGPFTCLGYHLNGSGLLGSYRQHSGAHIGRVYVFVSGLGTPCLCAPVVTRSAEGREATARDPDPDRDDEALITQRAPGI